MEQKPKKNIRDPFELEGFWREGIYTDKTNSRFSPKFLRIVFYFSLFLIVTVLLFSRGVSAKKEIDVLGGELKTNLKQTVYFMQEGRIKEALFEIEAANKNIKKIKLNTQSWGQDIEYLSYISDKKSSFTEQERLVNSVYKSLSSFANLEKNVQNILSFSLNSGLGESENFMLDIGEKSELLSGVYEVVHKNLLESQEVFLSLNDRIFADFGIEKEEIATLVDDLIRSTEDSKKLFSEDLVWLSGADGTEKNILIIFQNNAELRGGSGGSLGSFGIGKFSGGRFLGIEFGKNIYKLDNAFRATGTAIAPPEELRWLDGDQWVLKDAGWSVDGEEALKKIEEFYELESGNAVDGVMTIDSTAFTRILDFTGPIDMSKYGKTISAKNFRTEVEYEVHKGYFEREGGKEENEPKKILSDMMPKVIEALFEKMSSKDGVFDFFATAKKCLDEKNILFYFEQDDFQRRINSYNISGRLMPLLGDYLHINNSNIDGAKSSLNVMNEVWVDSKLNSSGEIATTIKLDRLHMGNGEWPDGLNKNFVRIILPRDANLTSFTAKQGNFERFLDRGNYPEGPYKINRTAKYVEVGFWMNTEPFGKSSVEIAYTHRIEPKEEFRYPVAFQKQPGAPYDKIHYSLEFPEVFELTRSPAAHDTYQNRLLIDFVLKNDTFYLLHFKKVR